MEQNNLVEGEEFNVIDSEGCAIAHNPYKFHKGLLLDEDEYVAGKTIIGNIVYNTYIIVKLPFEPKVGDYYYIIDYTAHEGYSYYRRNSRVTTIYNNLVSRDVKLYKTEAEVIKIVKKLGWV